ncbi:hypothetical protein [Bradyrhizobium sp.]|jgi:hypothetical protein|uniref:hypothetical protein n=1 Tax=Bradyrhizobium sp. TaxID=376 RepID=UPI003D1075E9
MSTSPLHEHHRIAPVPPPHEQAGDVSRRAMLAGTVASTAAAAVGPISGSAYAQGADPMQDMMKFLVLSGALTGIQIAKLAPEFQADPKKPGILNADPGVDPINVKNDYFKWINASDGATFGKLLQIASDNSDSAPDIINAVNASDDTKFLARSIVLLWYLGSWYEPKDLQKNSAPGARALLDSQVLSAKAYTQGLVWQIAQAHPMGYSNLQFGYWSREPNDLNDPGDRSNLGLITQTIP